MNKSPDNDYHVRLSSLEWAIVQLAYKPDSAPIFVQYVEQNITPEQLRGALLASRARNQALLHIKCSQSFSFICGWQKSRNKNRRNGLVANKQ